MPTFWCSAQHFGNISAILKPVVGDFYEHFSKQGFFDSLVGWLWQVRNLVYISLDGIERRFLNLVQENWHEFALGKRHA
jgi:hypothetical protein